MTIRTLTAILGTMILSLLADAAAAEPNYRQRLSQQRESYETLDDVRAEIAFGREVAANLLGRFGLYQDRELNRYLGLVGRGLALHCGRPELEFHFAVLDTDERNAFAAPGGYIFVTRGALASMRDESELAAVLAHEIAHVTERHIVRELKIRGPEAQEGAALTSLIGGMTDSMRVAFAQMVEKAMEILLDKGYRQQDEADADRLGVTLAAMVGYDGHALLRYLELLGGDGDAAGDRIGTHPPNADRVALLRRFVEENRLVEKSSSILRERYAAHVRIR